MCCWNLFVVVMLLIMIEAASSLPKKRKMISEVGTTKKYAITYTKSKNERNDTSDQHNIINPEDTTISAPLNNVEAPTAKNKRILHKCHIKDDPSQITDCADEGHYEFCEEFTEEYWKETIFEYDMDDW